MRERERGVSPPPSPLRCLSKRIWTQYSTRMLATVKIWWGFYCLSSSTDTFTDRNTLTRAFRGELGGGGIGGGVVKREGGRKNWFFLSPPPSCFHVDILTPEHLAKMRKWVLSIYSWWTRQWNQFYSKGGGGEFCIYWSWRGRGSVDIEVKGRGVR